MKMMFLSIIVLYCNTYEEVDATLGVIQSIMSEDAPKILSSPLTIARKVLSAQLAVPFTIKEMLGL